MKKRIYEDKKEKALELYNKGKCSMEQAAKFADMYIGEFYDLLRQRGIESNLTLDDFEESLKHIERIQKIS